jgi:prepilin-type N-terminal cleavage/methylation domain-containing protein
MRRLNGASQVNREAERRGFTLIEVMVVIALIAIIIAFLLPLRRGGAVRVARRTQCVNNMKQIALALCQYEGAYGCLPPVYTTDSTGRPIHSWRALILPYLDQKALYDSIDFTKPWDDPANDNARGSTVPVCRCPEATEACNTTT